MKFTPVILNITAFLMLAQGQLICGDREYRSVPRLMEIKQQSERLIRSKMFIDGFPKKFDDTDGLEVQNASEEPRGTLTKPFPGGYLQFPLTLQPFKGGMIIDKCLERPVQC